MKVSMVMTMKRRKKKNVENAVTMIVQVHRLFDILGMVHLRKAMMKLMYISLLVMIAVCYFSVFSVLFT